MKLRAVVRQTTSNKNVWFFNGRKNCETISPLVHFQFGGEKKRFQLFPAVVYYKYRDVAANVDPLATLELKLMLHWF